jgi:hypothetical protein
MKVNQNLFFPENILQDALNSNTGWQENNAPPLVLE